MAEILKKEDELLLKPFKELTVVGEGKWKEMTSQEIQDIANCFIPKTEYELDMSKLDFTIKTKDYYKKKFKNFPEHVYDLLEECSQKKLASIEEQQQKAIIEKGEFVVSFGA